MRLPINPEMEGAFVQAYREHADALFRHCFFKVSDRELAVDLLSDTFARTWAYLEKGGEVVNMKAFLYKTANNLIIDHYRKKKNVSLEVLHEKGFDPSFSPEERMKNQLDGASAMELLREIPEIYREVIFMRYVQELTVKEIAEILEDTENNVSVKLHRGLGKIRDIINKKEIYADEQQI